ncbi:hypothetical protein ACH5RR_012365 [Cinchona calisaya]|uniref:CCHC-type domain-containing protein n=1 Tax=Cinchona calisaya TaxID=153742 RepID=A0ABD3A7M0_9GENT
MRIGGATNANNFKGKSRLEIKKQNDKYFECGQLGHFANECPSKKKKEGRKPRFNNFQIIWDDCNFEGEVEEEMESAQMAFMAIGDDEVNSNYDSNDENGEDDLETFILKLHDNLKESYARNKELVKKSNDLLNANSKLVNENNRLSQENRDLKKRMHVRSKVKEEQASLKKRMDDLNALLIRKKENIVDMKRNRNIAINKNFVIFRRDDLCIVKPKSFLNGTKSIICRYCQQHGHVKNMCYVKNNEKLGMKVAWIESNFTKSNGPKKIWVPKVIN